MQTALITRSFLVLHLSLFALLSFTTPAVAGAHPAASYVFTVNTTHDTHDAHPGDGVCADQGGHCSLRAAIEEADALPTGSVITITVPRGIYTLILGTLGLSANTITITGASSKTTVIDGNHQFTVMTIASRALSPLVSVSLSQLIIENGYGYGGGIYNKGTLSVSESTLRGNSTTFDNNGGAIDNWSGTLSVSDSIFSGNSASAGGGIENAGGMLSVSDSTFSHNSAVYPAGSGGAIENYEGILSVTTTTFSHNSANDGGGGGEGGVIRNVFGMLSASASTFSDNSTDGRGGGIYNYGGALQIRSSTFSHNSANAIGGGGIYTDTGTLSVGNSTFSENATSSEGGGVDNSYAAMQVSASTFSGNSASTGGSIDAAGGMTTLTTTIVANSPNGGNCAGTITDGGYNLDSGTSCGFHLSTDLTHTDPLLGPLGDYGGPTQTMPLRQGSPAIDWIPASLCTATDQRGQPRPDNGENVCDIGAYENMLNQ